MKLLKRNSIAISVWLGIIFCQQSTNQVYGFITDSTSGEALIGANVFIRESGQGMATDNNGYYVLSNIAIQEAQLVVSYVGYKRYEKSINFSEIASQNYNIALQPESIELMQVDVTAEEIERLNKIEPSRVNLSPRILKAQPSLAEPDIFRTIQSLPGVLTTSEFSTGLVIRGGNTDQNLILLDGITVYNPSHLGGLFSNFIVDAVKDAELIKGGYNAEYGGRLSAVLDIRSREGNRNNFEGSSSVSLLSAQTTLEGPFLNGAWLVAGRRTYFDKILPLLPVNFDLPYYFYDLQGHVFTDLNEKDRISLSFYRGVDDLKFKDLDLESDWGNKTLSLSYRRVFNEKLIGNFLAANSQFYTRFGLGGDAGIQEYNPLSDQTLSGDLAYFHNQDFNVFFGAQAKSLSITYNSKFNDRILFDSQTKPFETAFYTKIKWKPNQRFIIEPGVRLITFSSHSDGLYPDLRLSTKFIIDESRFINFAIGNYHQFISTFQDDFTAQILDSWFAIDETGEPSRASQAVLGYEQFIGRGLKVQIEGYYKKITDMLTYEESRATTDGSFENKSLLDLLTPADGYAYGAELFIQQSTGKLSGWAGYSWSVSRKLMNGKEYFTNWDRSHVINVLANYQASPKWEYNLKFTLQSGQAFTPINGYFLQNLPGETQQGYRTIPATRNGGRYPSFHRLDLGAVRHFDFKGRKFDVFMQVINAYNRKNIFTYTYPLGNTFNGIDDDRDWDRKDHDNNGNGRPDKGEPNVDEDDEGRIQRNPVSLFPIIPTIGITWNF
ncbi:MAG: TonB-dependent receptor [Candidatus Neomarinimicrobiota bacterium]|nr:TonB-dependent receptor [Candidatus Neomarinimicrobiota bacterium]